MNHARGCTYVSDDSEDLEKRCVTRKGETAEGNGLWEMINDVYEAFLRVEKTLRMVPAMRAEEQRQNHSVLDTRSPHREQSGRPD